MLLQIQQRQIKSYTIQRNENEQRSHVIVVVGTNDGGGAAMFICNRIGLSTRKAQHSNMTYFTAYTLNSKKIYHSPFTIRYQFGKRQRIKLT